MSQQVITKIPLYKLSFNKLSLWYYLDGYVRNSEVKESSLSNLNSNKVKGKFSRKSSKRLTEIVNNWVSCVQGKMMFNNESKKMMSKYLTFITLTLSSTQIHDDKFVRKNMLHRFIQDLKRKHNVVNYLYCSEAQKNGNIHFHIVADRNIYWKSIRELWNNCQSSYGYIDEFERKHKHRNPNSTDIHSFKKINNVAAYLVKYFTKTENRRKIEGRLWGCSDGLRDIAVYEGVVDWDINDIVLKLKKIDTIYTKKDDWFELYKFNDIMKYSNIFKPVIDNLIEFYNNEFNKLNGLGLELGIGTFPSGSHLFAEAHKCETLPSPRDNGSWDTSHKVFQHTGSPAHSNKVEQLSLSIY